MASIGEEAQVRDVGQRVRGGDDLGVPTIMPRRDVACRVLRFPGDEARVLPSAVRPEHADHRRAEPDSAHPVPPSRHCAAMRARSHREQPHRHDGCQSDQLRDRQRVPDGRRQPDPHDVHAGEDDEPRDGHRAPPGLAERDEVPDILGEDERQRGDGARRDHQEVSPPLQEPDEPAKGLGQPLVHAAGPGIAAASSANVSAPARVSTPPENPREEDARAGGERRGDLRRRAEDARADAGTGRDEDEVEEGQAPGERGHESRREMAMYRGVGAK